MRRKSRLIQSVSSNFADGFHCTCIYYYILFCKVRWTDYSVRAIVSVSTQITDKIIQSRAICLLRGITKNCF